MPLFKVTGKLIPFRLLKPGADLYEKEIEELVWGDLGSLHRRVLVARCSQPTLNG